MRVVDEYIERLGAYFVHQDIAARWGITFEQFFKIVERGDWEDLVS